MSVWIRLFKLFKRSQKEKYGHLSFIIHDQKEEMYRLRKCICRLDNENRELKSEVRAQRHGRELINHIENVAELTVNECYGG